MKKSGKFVSAALCVAIAPSAVSAFAESKDKKETSSAEARSSGEKSESVEASTEAIGLDADSTQNKKMDTEKSSKKGGKRKRKNRINDFEGKSSSQLNKVLNNRNVQIGLGAAKAIMAYAGVKKGLETVKTMYKGSGIKASLIPKDIDPSVRGVMMNRKNDFSFLENDEQKIKGLAYSLDAMREAYLDDKKNPSELLAARKLTVDKGDLADVLGRISINEIVKSSSKFAPKLNSKKMEKLKHNFRSLTNSLSEAKEQERIASVDYSSRDMKNDAYIAARANGKVLKDMGGDLAPTGFKMVGEMASKGLESDHPYLSIIVKTFCEALGIIANKIFNASAGQNGK